MTSRTLASLLVCVLFACGGQPASGPGPESVPPPASAEERAKECDSTLAAMRNELERLSTCSSDPECGRPISTFGSCGCTRDAVVRLDADDTKYMALLQRLQGLSDVPACAPRSGTCDCPAMDGYICDGHCGWKPLDRSTLCARTLDSYIGTRKRECEPNVEECAATLTLDRGDAVLVVDGKTHLGRYQCADGRLHIEGGLVADGDVNADRTLNLLDDVFKPALNAVDAIFPAPAPVEHGGPRSTFMPASGEINCVYIAAGGTDIYMPRDGGPELICDRSSGHSYERVYLGPKGPGQIARNPGERSCCSIEPILPEGGRLVRGPFQCELTGGEIICKREDGNGVAIGGKRARVLRGN